MMIKQIYAIYDGAVQSYGTQFPAENDKAAMRILMPTVNHPDSYINTQPKDFSLWRVGSFDMSTGILSGTESGKPEFVYEAMDLLHKEDK